MTVFSGWISGLFSFAELDRLLRSSSPPAPNPHQNPYIHPMDHALKALTAYRYDLPELKDLEARIAAADDLPFKPVRVGYRGNINIPEIDGYTILLDFAGTVDNKLLVHKNLYPLEQIVFKWGYAHFPDELPIVKIANQTPDGE